MPYERADVVVIGGGIAGVSAGYELARDRAVQLLEAEPTLAAHSTGRSAATVVVGIGPPAIQRLTRASLPGFHAPPFPVDAPLLSPRPSLFVGSPDRIRTFHAGIAASVPAARLVPSPELSALCPPLRADDGLLGALDPTASDVDVAALHQGYVRALRARGGRIDLDDPVVAIVRDREGWMVRCRSSRTVRAGVVVDAAGAWADDVAESAGVAPRGLVARRRSVFIAPSSAGPPDRRWPTLVALERGFYLKPEGDAYLCSPVDATAEPAGHSSPDVEAIARALDDINDLTTLGLRSVRRSWAGQRSFFPDELPALGMEPGVEGFIWCAGQGGYGIQTAPAASRLVAALVRGEPAPEDLLACGVDPAAFDPGRLAPVSTRGR